MASPRVYTPSDDFGLSVALGQIRGVRSALVEGRRPNIINAGIYDLIPAYADTANFPSDSGETVEVVSSDADDAVQVRIDYLDASFDEGSEVVTLNGTTPVALSEPVTRINYLENVDVSEYEGSVDVRATGGGLVFCRAEPSFQHSLQAVYSAPKNYRAAIASSRSSLQKSGGAEADVSIRFRWRMIGGGVFLTYPWAGLQRVGDTTEYSMAKFPRFISGPADIVWSAEVFTSGSEGATLALRSEILLLSNR